MKNIIFINTHPIQYFAPLYKYLNRKGLKTKVWYCSDHSIKGSYDKEFGVKVKWDIPLLEGYESKFFKNYAPKQNKQNGFFSFSNFGMIYQLFSEPKSVIVVHGWNYITQFGILFLGKLKGHTICLRSETPLVHEERKKGLKQRIKLFVLKHLLFPRIDYFLFIGTQNKLFFKSLGVKDENLLFCPYCIDNERFSDDYMAFGKNKLELKQKIGVSVTDNVILYSGKYIDKKRPIDLLLAFKKLNKLDCWLVMVGEGELRKQMEELIEKEQIKNVILTGFVNQSTITEFYALSDVFVMCSTLGETWGLSVNEAMNFNLPVIISDLTGSSYDLVEEGINGYVFRMGDVDQLADKLHQLLYCDGLSWERTSRDIIQKFDFSTIYNSLKTIV